MDLSYNEFGDPVYFNEQPPWASYHATTNTPELVKMSVLKPVRLVYEYHGQRRHLTLGDGKPMEANVTIFPHYASKSFISPATSYWFDIKLWVPLYTLKNVT